MLAQPCKPALPDLKQNQQLFEMGALVVSKGGAVAPGRHLSLLGPQLPRSHSCPGPRLRLPATAVPDLYNPAYSQFMIPTPSADLNATNSSCLSAGDSAACTAPFPNLGRCMVGTRCLAREGIRNWRGAQVFLPTFIPGGWPE